MANNALDPLGDIRRHGHRQTGTYLVEDADDLKEPDQTPVAWLAESHELETNTLPEAEIEQADLLTGVIFPDYKSLPEDQDNPPTLSL